MKYSKSCLSFLLLLIAFNCAAPSSEELDSQDTPGEPLLLLDNDEGNHPLSFNGIGADNSRCHVCHLNYTFDDIAVNHAQADIGCKDCHGESDAHIDDESWSWGGPGTAPGAMYRRSEVNAMCTKCHAEETLDVAAHDTLLSGSEDAGTCTDCHGDHRLHKRRTNWKQG